MGWKRQDFIETILAAERANLVAVGGQVQFLFPNATCELYWLSYKSNEKQSNENWAEYCHRAAQEIIEQFKKLCETTDFIQEGIKNFDFLAQRNNAGINLNQHLVFIVYFKAQT